MGIKLQAGSDLNRAESYEYFIWTVDKLLQKKRKPLCVSIFNQVSAKWKSLFIHLEGIPEGGMNPTGLASLSNVPLYNSLPPVISEEFINSQSKEPTRHPDCVSSSLPTPNIGEQGKKQALRIHVAQSRSCCQSIRDDGGSW